MPCAVFNLCAGPGERWRGTCSCCTLAGAYIGVNRRLLAATARSPTNGACTGSSRTSTARGVASASLSPHNTLFPRDSVWRQCSCSSTKSSTKQASQRPSQLDHRQISASISPPPRCCKAWTTLPRFSSASLITSSRIFSRTRLVLATRCYGRFVSS